MKILQLTKKFPYPVKDGEAIAIYTLASSLQQLGAEVTLLCMNTPKHFFDIQELPDSFNHYKNIHAVEVDTSVKSAAAFANLFSNKSYHISRFDNDAYRKKLIVLLETGDFDIVQLETLFLAPYLETIRNYSKAKIVMRAHNVEHEIWERITSNTSFLPKRYYLQLLTSRLATYEKGHLNKYDLLLPITKRDLEKKESLGFRQRALVTPIGLNATDYQLNEASYQKPLSISFIGSLDWMPNVEGLQWFLEKVWPVATKNHPDLVLHLAGRNTPDDLYKLENEQLKIHGEIPDAKAFINDHSLMLVPLLSGSGMRVKILEGMALGKVVLTTTIGLEGIDAIHKENVLIADNPKEFLEALEYCHSNKEKLQSIGKAARQLIVEKYDNLSIAKRVLDAYTLSL
ncbi:MAG: glycosyltransferase family 4 protein [Saprospiraceae bacterium]